MTNLDDLRSQLLDGEYAILMLRDALGQPMSPEALSAFEAVINETIKVTAQVVLDAAATMVEKAAHGPRWVSHAELAAAIRNLNEAVR